jgi:hypothetical protein
MLQLPAHISKRYHAVMDNITPVSCKCYLLTPPYREFTRRAMEAGVQGYFAFLTGKRATYLGRTGDQHVEWFPGAAPTAKAS